MTFGQMAFRWRHDFRRCAWLGRDPDTQRLGKFQSEVSVLGQKSLRRPVRWFRSADGHRWNSGDSVLNSSWLNRSVTSLLKLGVFVFLSWGSIRGKETVRGSGGGTSGRALAFCLGRPGSNPRTDFGFFSGQNYCLSILTGCPAFSNNVQ